MTTDLRGVLSTKLAYAATDKSLSDIIEKQIVECSVGRKPADYFYLTELVNPMDAYWDRVSPTPQPIDILQKLKYGQKMHYASRFWFQHLDGYAVAEATLNGHYVGIPGVVGRVDYAIGDSILEFKTKESKGVTKDDVLDLYPHDLEQLLFYAVLSPKHPKTNFLVYMTRRKDGSAQFHAFRVEVRKFEPLEQELRSRMKALSNSVSNKTPAGLPQCRYYEPGCRFARAGTCSCSTAKPIGARALLSAITISDDEPLRRKVLELYGSTRLDTEGYDVWDLILPRKWYHDNFDYTLDEELSFYSGLDPTKLTLLALIDSAVAASPLATTKEEKKAAAATDALSLSGGRRFMKVVIPARGKGAQVVPYIAKKHGGKRIPSEWDLPDTYYPELGLQCARTGVPTGIAVVHFPNANNRTVCYALGFDIDRVTHAANSAKEALREARQKGTPDGLDKCPDYMWASCQFKGCSCRTAT